MLCINCKFAVREYDDIWESWSDSVDCKKNLPEPVWDEEEECEDCDCYMPYDPIEYEKAKEKYQELLRNWENEDWRNEE